MSGYYNNEKIAKRAQSLKRRSSIPVLVLVDDDKAVDLLDLVPQHVHQLLHKLRVPLVLKRKD